MTAGVQGRRILCVAINFSPELTGVGKYVGEMSAWLADQGAEVRVVTAPPYYPQWRVQAPYSAGAYQVEQLDGARVYRCPLWVPARPRGLTRILHLLSFAVSSLPVVLWQGLSWRPDVVIVMEPALASAPAAWLAARLGGAKAWLHVQDFEVDAAFELNLLRAGWMQRAVLAAERWLMGRFDRVSSISERMLGKLRKKGVAESRIAWFPNWVDMSMIRPLEGANALRAELGIGDGQRVVLYSGNMGEKQGLEVIVEAARGFSAAEASATPGVDWGNVLFLLCGDGAVRARIEAQAAGLPNVRFIPLQPLSRLNELLNLAEVHLLPQRADAEDLVMPSKLTAIMASGRPVVATARAGSDVGNVAVNGGIVVAPGDQAAFAGAIAGLLQDEGRRRALGASGRDFALANWDQDAILRRVFAQWL